MPTDDFDFDEGSEQSVDWSEKLHGYYYLAKQLLRKYWWIPAITTSMGVLYQSYQASQSQPTYSSSAIIMHNQFVANMANVESLREQYSNWFGNQALILRSGEVQSAARERVSAFYPDLPTGWVNIRPSQMPETTAIQVFAQGSQPEYTRRFLDAVLDEYMNRRRQMKGETSEVALTAITEKLLALEDQIQSKEDAVVDFRKQNNLISIQEQGNKAGSNLAQLRARQADIRTQIRLLDTMGVDYNIDGPQLFGNGDLLSESVASNYAQAQRELNQVEARLKQFEQYLRPRHPKIIALRQEIERKRNLMKIYRDQARDEIEARREQLVREMENFDIVISEQEEIALENSRLQAEFERLNANLERLRSFHENLLRQMQNIEAGQEVSTEVVSIFQRATGPSESRVSMQEMVIQGALGGALLGVGFIALIGFIDNRIISAEDLKKRFEAPVFALIPLEERNDSGRLTLLAPKDPRHLFSEACRTLRSSLFFMGNDGRRPKLIVITSSIPEEGKSTIAANLAAAISFTSSKVLLVDCDLRRGQLAAAFNGPAIPGMSDVLQKGRRMDAVVQKTERENLDFIPSGEYPERPGELLLSFRMDEVLREMREHYDYVILDTAPILATDDTTGFAVKADALIYVTRSGYTQSRQVRTAVERLRMRGVQVSGFVLNCVDTRGTDYYYYKKYNDYYAHTAN
jgi:capsular exopolysaccharide synthesis family protein